MFIKILINYFLLFSLFSTLETYIINIYFLREKKRVLITRDCIYAVKMKIYNCRCTNSLIIHSNSNSKVAEDKNYTQVHLLCTPDREQKQTTIVSKAINSNSLHTRISSRE